MTCSTLSRERSSSRKSDRQLLRGWREIFVDYRFDDDLSTVLVPEDQPIGDSFTADLSRLAGLFQQLADRLSDGRMIAVHPACERVA